ncbi:MAG: hypothetical protein V4760_10595 [Bdellovibrionota bacterium]
MNAPPDLKSLIGVALVKIHEVYLNFAGFDGPVESSTLSPNFARVRRLKMNAQLLADE